MWRKYTFLPIFCCLILGLAWWSLRERHSLGRDPSGVLTTAFNKDVHEINAPHEFAHEFHDAHDAMLRHSLTHPLLASVSKYSKGDREGSTGRSQDKKDLRGSGELRDDMRLELLETLNRISQEIEGMKFALEHSAQKKTMGSSSVKSLEIEELKEFEKEGL